MQGDTSVIIAIPVLLIGGTEIQTLHLVRVLFEAGYSVKVCCYYEYDPEMVKRFEAAGAKVHLMKYERAKGLWHLAKGLIQQFKRMKPDIVHVQYVAPGFVPVLAARLAGIKTIFATVHQPGRVYGWKEKLLLRTAAKLCTAFFCVSKAAEESWFGSSELFDPTSSDRKRKHFTIYNSVDTELITKAAQSADRDGLRKSLNVTSKKIIGFVGRMRWEKGLDILIDALPPILMVHPTAVLLVVGDGPDKEGLRLRAKGLGLENNIVWLGQKSPEEVNMLYSIMNVVAVPSLFEGFGLTAVEAMAAGVPVVATRVDGLSEVVHDGVSGYLVESGNAQKLAQALINLLSNSEKAAKMGQEGYRRVSEKFSLGRFSDSVTAAYKTFGSLMPLITEV